jgi:hypothetical protein
MRLLSGVRVKMLLFIIAVDMVNKKL